MHLFTLEEGGFPRLLCVSRWIDMYVLVGRWQLFLADVVVVVKRCKEEQTTCPYIWLYTTAPLVFLRYIDIHINISSPSLQLSLPPSHQGQLSSYTTQQPSTHPTAYTYKRQTFTATHLKYSSTINAYLPTHSHTFSISTSKHQPPPPPISALSPKSSPETPKQKINAGRAGRI